MNKELLENDFQIMVENVNLYSKRLYLLIKNIRFDSINNADKIIICDLFSEMAYNIQSETQNITLAYWRM